MATTAPVLSSIILVSALASACASRQAPTDPGAAAPLPASAGSAIPQSPSLRAASAAPSCDEPPTPVSAPADRTWPEPGKRIPLELPGAYAEAWPPYAPAAEGGAPVSVYFHGMTATAELECPVARGAMDNGWVVCADGNVPYGGGFVWTAPGCKARVDAAIGALQARHGDLVSERRGLLIGYSMGAVPAWYHLEHSSDAWTGLVLLNTKFAVRASVLKAKGLLRVALVAGQYDASAGTMRNTARSLERQGVDARFFQLEATGHYFDDKTWERMLVPLRWALGGHG